MATFISHKIAQLTRLAQTIYGTPLDTHYFTPAITPSALLSAKFATNFQRRIKHQQHI